ncbi:Carboxylesterase [Kribbella flavida DSM 17836]|uniref:Carboxylic ester hydrolase n=1 Tax=Kribbella flavida (strain DSM 17836 / JCM 10339 / NBRC 14399) TaxID=479435 RepID=D2PVA9_KRIFD|nr:carboxylesterase family protein [Kribbella flavida]ADB33390.1 Carboxylesterase [Kribbella flavida DSM 17836]
MRTKLMAIAGAGVLVTALGSAATAGVTSQGSDPGAAQTAAAATPPVTLTTGGLVRGTTGRGVDRYSGIPYAAPPLGALRWRAPAPAKSWFGVRDTTRPAAPCLQVANGKQLAGSAEDCLYLNVIRPHRPAKLGPKTLRPVMVWLHGGGNATGDGAEYDPARMADHGDVVVVTLNYRLGLFGFFGHPGLAHSGTFGLLDQQAALRWVQRNALFFGGDPGNVTLFGESAGGVDVCANLVSPAARGLFHRAILQSGSCHLGVPTTAAGGGPVYTMRDGAPFAPVAEVRTEGATLAARIAAGSCAKAARRLDCLRKLPAADLLSVSSGFGLASGTAALPLDGREALRTGRFNRVPVLSGNTSDEARFTTMFVEYLTGREIDAAGYRALLRQTFGADAAAVEKVYPAAPDPALAFAAMDTDRIFACPQQETTRALSRFTRTYAYEFADRTAPTYNLWLTDLPPGASHAAELAYLFDLRSGAPYSGLTPVTLTPAQRRLGDRMIDYWTGFARSGRPDGVDWPPYTVRTPYVRALSTDGDGRIDAAAAHRCAFWTALGG